MTIRLFPKFVVVSAFAALMSVSALSPAQANHHEEMAQAEGAHEDAAQEETASAVAMDEEALTAEARGLVKEFAGQLGGTLKTAIEEGGVEAGIAVCHEKAPEIAASLGAENGWAISRVSNGARNPNAEPDEWEALALAEFERRKAAGEEISMLETSAEEGEIFRYMKAIPTGEMCVMCHGKDIAPEIQATLDQYYPDDKGTGYEVGDIRGAFSLQKKTVE